MMRSRRRPLSLLLAATIALAPGLALAQAAAPELAPNLEAKQRHERGLRLYDAGDDAGALAEFKRAHELTGSVIDLYDLGLVYAKLGRAVEATDALDRVLAAPGSLPADALALARRRRDEQAARIAFVEVTANAEGGAIDIDGVEAAKTPLAAPLRVAGGPHVVGVVAAGFEPSRKEITIAAGERQSLRFDLTPIQGRLAHLAVKTHLPGADVFADDVRVGTTPLAASIALVPGKHRVALRRAGYGAASADLSLDDGATGEVTLEPEEDREALAQTGGELALEVSESQPVVTVDGRPRGVYAAPLRLVAGPHHLLVERGDFEPTERDVAVVAGGAVTVRVVLEPTPDYRARYVSHAQSMRTWGLVSLVGGLVAAGGGVGLLAYDAQQRSDGHAAFDAALVLPTCSNVGGLGITDTGSPYDIMCRRPEDAAAAKINDANARDYGAWAAVGVGAAAAGLGLTLLLAGGDPHRYDSSPTERVMRAPAFWVTAKGSGVALVGRF